MLIHSFIIKYFYSNILQKYLLIDFSIVKLSILQKLYKDILKQPICYTLVVGHCGCDYLCIEFLPWIGSLEVERFSWL